MISPSNREVEYSISQSRPNTSAKCAGAKVMVMASLRAPAAASWGTKLVTVFGAEHRHRIRIRPGSLHPPNTPIIPLVAHGEIKTLEGGSDRLGRRGANQPVAKANWTQVILTTWRSPSQGSAFASQGGDDYYEGTSPKCLWAPMLGPLSSYAAGCSPVRHVGRGYRTMPERTHFPCSRAAEGRSRQGQRRFFDLGGAGDQVEAHRVPGIPVRGGGGPMALVGRMPPPTSTKSSGKAFNCRR